MRRSVTLINLLDNPFADDENKTLARQQFLEIAEDQRQITRKQNQKSIKKHLSLKRRSQFQQQRPELMLALIDRDGYECAKCKSQDKLTIDHIIPLSKGGTDNLGNLRLLCRKCNSSKGDR